MVIMQRKMMQMISPKLPFVVVLNLFELEARGGSSERCGCGGSDAKVSGAVGVEDDANVANIIWRDVSCDFVAALELLFWWWLCSWKWAWLSGSGLLCYMSVGACCFFHLGVFEGSFSYYLDLVLVHGALCAAWCCLSSSRYLGVCEGFWALLLWPFLVSPCSSGSHSHGLLLLFGASWASVALAQDAQASYAHIFGGLCGSYSCPDLEIFELVYLRASLDDLASSIPLR
ncbi:hypothetical protein SUGI_0973670 [Cryptomeria japonica]|nr:hypothetical protein SUGI_0973670 [Cryptomeria japonica]